MKTIIIASIFLISVMGISQSDGKNEQFTFKSFSFSPSIYFNSSNTGIALSGDISYAYNKSIYTFSAIAGGVVCGDFFGSCNSESFGQINILYGRELMLTKKIVIDVHAGLGYFSYKSSSIIGTESGHSTTVGFPLTTKLRFKTGNRFSIGLQLHANINSVNTIYAAGILFQWNRKSF